MVHVEVTNVFYNSYGYVAVKLNHLWFVQVPGTARWAVTQPGHKDDRPCQTTGGRFDFTGRQFHEKQMGYLRVTMKALRRRAILLKKSVFGPDDAWPKYFSREERLELLQLRRARKLTYLKRR